MFPLALIGQLLVLPPALLPAQTTVKLQTGKALEKSLAESVSCSARRMPFLRQLQDIQQESGVCLIRDRRLDPSVPISLQTGFLPRREMLKQLAALIPGTAAAFPADYVYIGPEEAAHRLPLLLQLTEQQSAAWKRLPASAISRRTLLPVRPSWERPAVPAEVLITAARNAEIRFANPEVIPHDVWDSATLPPMTVPELACLILNQFDLCPQLSESSAEIRIVPIPSEQPLELRHSFPSELRASLEQSWGAGRPDTDVRWTRTTAAFTAALERHIQFAALAEQQRTAGSASQSARPAAAPDSLRTRMFQLQAERAPLGSIVATLRASGIRIDIAGEQTAEVQRALQQVVPISAAAQRGDEFFEGLFGRHFGLVQVLDDRVQLRQ
ncbi:MAG: hypothetical protein ACKO2P_20315 [Planctomycetota bacterium]